MLNYYESFLIPKVIEVEEISANHSKVVLAPFERGFGHTLGNALRRILLSSMPGAAPLEVEIEGRQHLDIVATIRTPETVTHEQIARIEEEIEDELNRDVSLDVVVLQVVQAE